MEIGKSKICSGPAGSGRAHVVVKVPELSDRRPRKESMLQFKSGGRGWKNALLVRGGQSFVQFTFSTDYMRSTHVMEGNLP